MNTRASPASIRCAISTSPSRSSSLTVPISRRYMRTGSLVFSSCSPAGRPSALLGCGAPSGWAWLRSTSRPSAAASAVSASTTSMSSSDSRM